MADLQAANHSGVQTPSIFVEGVITDPENPVVVFALEWCEFCWSVLKLFKHCDIPFKVVELDSAPFQKDNWGRQVRNALQDKTGCVTIPQVFIGGEFIGGCTETFDAFTDGVLQRQLNNVGVDLQEFPGLQPYSFLPKWLQPR